MKMLNHALFGAIAITLLSGCAYRVYDRYAYDEPYYGDRYYERYGYDRDCWYDRLNVRHCEAR